MLPLHGARVQSLVRELRSGAPYGQEVKTTQNLDVQPEEIRIPRVGPRAQE